MEHCSQAAVPLFSVLPIINNNIMKTEIIISGFGGQGVLSMGKILAYSGLMEDKEVTWMPAYGPEQRGGTANVTVIVSDERISSPILSKYDIAIVLNQPSLDKFEPKIKEGGILIYDSYGVINPPTRKDITVYRIDAMDAAAEMKERIKKNIEKENLSDELELIDASYITTFDSFALSF